MTAYLCLIPDAAQGNADIFLIQCPRNGTGYRGLTGSGRAHQTENRTASLLRQDPHGQILQHTLLDLLHAIVILVQNCFSTFQITAVPGCLVPGKLQHRLNITTKDCAFRRIHSHIAKSGDLLIQLFLHFLGGLQFLHFFCEMIRVGKGVILS